ncbi:MAG: ThuA domain-containing protein [Planctomycetaceae bacterium]
MPRSLASFLLIVVVASLSVGSPARAADLWLDLPGGDGVGTCKRVVLVSGDEEYRSEEALTQLAKILSARHGFGCRVVYAIDPDTGTIDPNQRKNIPGLEALRDADVMVIATRFRTLPDEQMKEVDAYLRRGKPVIGLRTATHGFDYPEGGTFNRYHWRNGDETFKEGFGRQVLGETWINHHGKHGTEGTKGLVAPGAAGHPILRGIADGDVFGPTDVYGVRLPLPGDSQALLLGQVLTGLAPDTPPVEGAKNDPLMPIAWTKTYSIDGGPAGRVFTTTMGASQDLLSEGFRRLLVNACYWAAGLDDRVPDKADVAIVGEFEPSPFKPNGFKKGVKPADLQ